MIGKRIRHRNFNAEGIVIFENGILLEVKITKCGSLDSHKIVDGVAFFDRRWVDVIEEENKLVDIIVYGTKEWREYMLKMENEVGKYE